MGPWHLVQLMERDYILIEDFLPEEQRKFLLNYFETNIESVRKSINVNPVYDGRLIYYEVVQEPDVKAAMRRVHDQCAQKLQEFYSESDRIYPESTHLVKWPEGTGLGEHADNAFADGRPNYTPWRSHSAVCYLNDDYDGGEFYFKRPEGNHEFKPTAGMLVAFRGGVSHVHGVKMVTRGTRMTMPMWFTQKIERAYPEYRQTATA